MTSLTTPPVFTDKSSFLQIDIEYQNELEGCNPLNSKLRARTKVLPGEYSALLRASPSPRFQKILNQKSPNFPTVILHLHFIN
jgi:hypothetical protein